jgi:putative isomerase
MLRHTTIPVERAWNTWSSRPAEMVFLPLGVRVTPVAYADSVRKATLFPAGKGLTQGVHALDGSSVSLELEHAGTLLEWHWRKQGPFDLSGGWRTRQTGEWGLRFWVNVCLSAEGGETVQWDPSFGVAWVKVGHRFVALAPRSEPVQVTGHETVEAVAADYEAKGYFSLSARAEEAPVLALRFNLEMQSDFGFGVSVADDLALAAARARDAARDHGDLPRPIHTGRSQGMLDAIRDVVGWLTVWDPVNRRPYTAISRSWDLTKFGGFGVWLDDQLYTALFAGLFDPEQARENLATALANVTPHGNLACLVTANDAWVDRTQIPVASLLVWMLYLRGGGEAVLRQAWETLARNHRWWWENRDPERRGLVSYGTSDVGEGLYKGTSFGARNESSMDNSPIHDEAEYDPETRTLTTIDVGLNSMLALDAEMLSLIAAELGHEAEATKFAHLAERTRTNIRTELWDASRGIFANRLRGGGFVRSVGPTSFYPLIAAAADEEQVESLLRHLADDGTFGGEFRVPSVSRDDPSFHHNVYWRGRVWPPLNWTIWQGLRRYGRFAEATALARDSERLFRSAWDRRLCPENYNAVTGEPLDQPDTEGFYGWGALMPMMAVGEILDVSPWHGWTVVNDGGNVGMGPLRTPAGLATLRVEEGVLELVCGERVLMRTGIRGRLSRLRFETGHVSMVLPDGAGEITLPRVPPGSVLLATVGGQPAVTRDEGGELRVSVPAGGDGRELVVVWRA